MPRCLFLLVVLLAGCLPAPAQEAIDYEAQIRPLLKRRCVLCHGPRRQQGGLRLDLKSAVFPAARAAWVIVPGHPERSELMRRLLLPDDHPKVMPSKGKKLSEDEKELVRMWIAAGAPWPGEPEVTAPEPTPAPATADPIDFAGQIQPLLKRRCYICHGPRRQKGDFRLDLKSAVFPEARAAWTIVPGHPERSELLRRVMLPHDHPKIMPLKGKKLTEDEKTLLAEWIRQGAKWPEEGGEERAGTPAPKKTSAWIRTRTPEEVAREDAAFAALRALGGHAARVARNDPACEVSFSLVPEAATDAILPHLRALAGSLVWLDLRGARLGAEGLQALGELRELRKLNLARTDASAASLGALTGLTHLESLNLHGTGVGDDAIDALTRLPALKRVYLWESAVTEEGAQRLRARRAGLMVQRGPEKRPR